MFKLFISVFVLLLVASTSPAPESAIGGELALIERSTDSDFSNVTRLVIPQIREHYGNPALFMKYIIAIPPVYV
ncbi:MAG: hypothetical protein O3C68_01505 [Proteobacteria bacterium]|nr:hypothetical protein [Pseudomonadota bacterium]